MKLNISLDKQEIFIKSIMWNSIIEVFQTEKNIDITKYLVSIRLNWNIILLKTNRPLINTEALLFDDKIKKTFSNKIKKVWIIFEKYDIKYI
jgi:hypothetical protein